MILWRVLPWDPSARPAAPGGALWFPRPFQGTGRHDNPARYGCLYVCEEPVAAIAEALAPFRGTGDLRPELLERMGPALALARLGLEDGRRAGRPRRPGRARRGVAAAFGGRDDPPRRHAVLRRAAVRDPRAGRRAALVVDARGELDQRHAVRPRRALAQRTRRRHGSASRTTMCASPRTRSG